MSITGRWVWVHCTKHNLDYPSNEECPYCKQERILIATDPFDREQFEPDEDAEFIMGEYEPECVKKLKLNLRYAYWVLRAKFYDLKEAFKLWLYDMGFRRLINQ